MADTPRTFWPLQEASGNPQDVSGNGLNITTVTGSPTYHLAGPFTDAFAIDCDGVNDVLQRAAVGYATAACTTEAWVQVFTTAGGGGWFFASNRALSNGWFVSITPSTMKFNVNVAGVDQGFSSNRLTLNTWYHIVVVYDGAVWKYYLNAEPDNLNAGNKVPVASTGTLDILAESGLDCSVAYVAIYDSALSLSRIQAHYAQRALGPEIAWTTA